MINFRDVLLQTKLPQYGAFWCDENVYRIATELQLLISPKFIIFTLELEDLTQKTFF